MVIAAFVGFLRTWEETMRRQSLGLIVAFFGLILAVGPALAHHSPQAEFDASKQFTITGVLTHIDWTNPHIYWYVDVKDAAGSVTTYSFEGFPPGMLHRAGVTKDMFKTGETVTVTAIAAKDGTKHLGWGKVVRYSDGHELVMTSANTGPGGGEPQ